MKKRTTQTLLLVFSTLLLLVSVTVSAQGQPEPLRAANFSGVWNATTDQGEIRTQPKRELQSVSTACSCLSSLER
jgi:hypothetical protein